MVSYIEDVLVKYNCDGCKGDFILSEYQADNADKNIICPYCSYEKTQQIMKYDPKEAAIDIPGCISIGHYKDPQKEQESYERTWGRIMEIKINNLINKMNGTEWVKI